jgi:Zn finger protein HypA/HybF involved in hydrogenase expression
MKVKVSEIICKRCGHKWHPRKCEVVVCPKCHSPYWNKEFVNKSIADELDKKLGVERKVEGDGKES